MPVLIGTSGENHDCRKDDGKHVAPPRVVALPDPRSVLFCLGARIAPLVPVTIDATRLEQALPNCRNIGSQSPKRAGE